MRYDDSNVRDVLAGEYVLGLLKGQARKRFERLMVSRTDWQHAVNWWASKLHLLSDALPGVIPSKQVWVTIEARLFANKQPDKGWWNAVDWWRGLALGATGIAAALALLVVMRSPEVVNVPVEVAIEVSAPTTVALLSDEQAKPAWLLALTKNKTGQSVIKVSALPSLKPVLNKSFELWVLPADKTKPVSIGLLPEQGDRLVAVNNQLAKLLVQGGLAVSLEPSGGSPTGQPTGEVLYQGKLREI